jgi:hypothetical protein
VTTHAQYNQFENLSHGNNVGDCGASSGDFSLLMKLSSLEPAISAGALHLCCFVISIPKQAIIFAFACDQIKLLFD